MSIKNFIRLIIYWMIVESSFAIHSLYEATVYCPDSKGNLQYIPLQLPTQKSPQDFEELKRKYDKCSILISELPETKGKSEIKDRDNNHSENKEKSKFDGVFDKMKRNMNEVQNVQKEIEYEEGLSKKNNKNK